MDSHKPLGRREIDYLNRLKRRRDWLHNRVFSAGLDGKDLSFDKAELSALTWAIDYIERLQYGTARP